MKHYRFIREGEDIINPQGKVTSYKEVNCIAADEQSARIKSKISEDYKLAAAFKLNSNW